MKYFFIDNWVTVIINFITFFAIAWFDIIHKHFDTPFIIIFIFINLLNLFFRYVETVIQIREEYKTGLVNALSISNIVYFGSYIVLLTIYTTLSSAESLKTFYDLKRST